MRAPDNIPWTWYVGGLIVALLVVVLVRMYING
jgi:hypothetical protein